MKPSQVAAQLVRIATKIQNSKAPDRTLVAAELKSLVRKIAGQYNSGDPATNGYDFDLTLYPSTSTSKSKIFKLRGMMDGEKLNGQLTIYLNNDEYNGWDYMPSPRSGKNFLQSEGFSTVLEAAMEELGLEY